MSPDDVRIPDLKWKYPILGCCIITAVNRKFTSLFYDRTRVFSLISLQSRI